jgi:phosphatidylethanolamine-binding protein (PEBP) family uncharacterized protein
MARRQTRRRQRGAGRGALTVQYSSAKVEGKLISLGATKATPSVILNVRPTPLYTLIMHDPISEKTDTVHFFTKAPGHSDANPWLHWLVINIPGSDFSQGQQLLEYSPPAPLSGVHKYKFTLYEQRFGRVQPSIPMAANFDLKAFIHTNSLIQVDEVYMRVIAI